MKQFTFAATAILALTAASCSDSQFDGYTRHETGMHYKFFTKNENEARVQNGDGIMLRYIISNERNDSVIVDSKNVSRDGSGYTQFPMSGPTFRGSFEDGLLLMSKGDSAAIIVRADSFFMKSMGYNELPPGIRNTDHLKAIFMVKDVIPAKQLEADRQKMREEQEVKMKEFESAEKSSMEKYLSENKINTKPTASGIYYIETKKGAGAQPKATDSVTVHYTGRLMDGTIFDSSVGDKPRTFVLNEVIPGWTEGVQMMRKGGKARLVLPSEMAYGPRGAGMIPPFAPLVFEVELIDVKAGGLSGMPGK